MVERSTKPTGSRILGALLSGLFLLAQSELVLAQTAALVPNASQQYFNANGVPLAGGKVYSYVPNTTTPKTTWLDPNQATANPNPVTLNAGGYAPSGSGGNGGIFGQGNYRQIVKDASDNLVWDGFTSAYGSSAPSGATGTDTAPVGTILPWAGFNFNVPTNWALAYGQALSRTTYSQLLQAITISTTTGNCTASSATVSGFADTSQLAVGSPIESPCLPTGNTVASIVNGTTITVAVAATATGTFTITAFPWGNGDGVSTFNLPDLRGRVMPGADAMGGAASGRLTSTWYTNNPATPASAGGGQDASTSVTFTLNASNIPTITSSGSNAISVAPNGNTSLFAATSSGTISSTNAAVQTGTVVPQTSSAWGSTSSFTGTNSISVTSNNTGAPSPVSVTSGIFRTIQPSITIDYIIKTTPNTTGAGGVVSLGGMIGDIVCATSFVCAPQGSPSVNTIGCAKATLSQLGCVIPDGTSVTINAGGVISAIVGVASAIVVGTTTVNSGTSGDILYNNAGVLGQLATTGTGNVVLASAPSVASPSLTGTVSGPTGTWDSTGLHNVPIGSTGASLGTFTSLTANSTATLNAGGSLGGGWAFAGTISGTPTFSGANFLSFSNLASAAASTLLGNASTSPGNVAPFTIGALLNKSTPATGDLLLLSDQAASGALKYCTIAQCIAAVSSGVTSLNGLTGVLTTGLAAPAGRISLSVTSPTTGNCAPNTDIVAAAFIYYAPCGGGHYVPIYDGTNVQARDISGGVATDTVGLILALGSNWPANTLFDLYATMSGGSPVLCTVAWSSSAPGTSARATALAPYSGWLTNAASATCRTSNTSTLSVAANQGTYLGTFLTNASAGQVDLKFGTAAAGGGAAVMSIWNAYNRVMSAVVVEDSVANFSTTATGTYQPMDVTGTGSGLNNRITFVTGNGSDAIDSSITLGAQPAASAQMQWGIGVNITNGINSRCITGITAVSSGVSGQTVPCRVYVAPGLNFLQGIMYSTSNSSIFVGSAAPAFGGLTASWLW